MRMKNYSDRPLSEAGMLGDGVVVQPGDEVEVEEGYCQPLRASNGSRMPSIVERVTPGLEPANEALRERWKAAAENWQPPKPKVVASDLVAQGVAPGVAAIKEAKAKAVEIEQSVNPDHFASNLKATKVKAKVEPEPKPESVPVEEKAAKVPKKRSSKKPEL